MRLIFLIGFVCFASWAMDESGEEDKTLQIFVKGDGGSKTIEVHEHETLGDLKRKIESKLAIPVNRQTLILHSKLLRNDDYKIAEYCIQNGNTLFVQPRLYPLQ